MSDNEFIIVGLHSFPVKLAQLVGLPGESSIEQFGDGLYLKGKYRFAVLGGQSLPLKFSAGPGGARVMRRGDAWELTALSPSRGFEFRQPNEIVLGGDVGPWCWARTVILEQDERYGPAPVISLPGASVSITKKASYSAERVLFYPTKDDHESVPLRSIRYPHGPLLLGIFLLNTDIGVAIHFGGLDRSVSLNRVDELSFGMTDSGTLAFRILNEDDPDACAVDMQFRNPAYVHLNESSKLTDDNASPFGARVHVTETTSTAGLLKVTQFRDDLVLLKRIHGSPSRLEERDVATRLLAPRERLAFYFPLDDEDEGKGRITQFVYRDEHVARAEEPGAWRIERPENRTPYSRIDRQTGLRIRGLPGLRGGEAALDASFLRIGLVSSGRPGASGATFEFKAGKPMPDPETGGLEPSYLVPKPDVTRDDLRRVLEIPVEMGILRCQVPLVLAGRKSPITFDTKEALLEFVDDPTGQSGDPPGVRLVLPPTGVSAGHKSHDIRQDDAAPAFSEWELRPKSSQTGKAEPIRFSADADGVFPEAGRKWTNAFKTVPKLQRLLQYQGTSIGIDMVADNNGLRMTEDTESTVVTTTEWDGKDALAYSAIATVLSYKLVEYIRGKDKQLCEDKINFIAKELTTEKAKEWVKSNAIDDLTIVFSSANGHQKKLREFIDNNIEDFGDATMAVWPFAFQLAIQLWHAKKLYCDQHPVIRRSKGKPGIGFDFSVQKALKPNYFGEDWPSDQFDRFAEKSPALWSTSPFGEPRLDPRSKAWRGIFFRDLPLTLAVDPKRIPTDFLENLFNSIDENLVLNYGWKDHTGATWDAALRPEADGLRITPKKWEKTFDLRLLGFQTTGTSGRPVSAEGKLAIKLDWLKDGTGKPLEIEGDFSLSITGSKVALSRIEIESRVEFASKSIPGFKEIRVKRLSTDLETLQLTLLLTPDENLASMLPFLDTEEPLEAVVSVSLKGDPSVTLALMMPSEEKTQLAGKWPFTIQGIALRIGDEPRLVISGRLSFGRASFLSVGARLIIQKRCDSWDIDAVLDEIAGSLEIGDFRLAGGLKWLRGDQVSDDAAWPPTTDAVSRDDIEQEARDREIWGWVTLDTGGLWGGEQRVLLRIGNKGEMTYWIAALGLDTEIPLGLGKLKKPVVLLANNADRDGELKKILAKADSIAGELRPPPGDERGWLAEWTPSEDIGFVVSASGYVHLHSLVAASAEKKDKIDDRDKSFLTAITVTTSGLIRIDSAVLFFNMLVKFMLSLDLECKRFTAAFQTPSFSFPPGSKEFTISAGQVVFGLGYGDKTDKCPDGGTFFRISVGWPERVSEYERNWALATRVTWDNMVPINTFWGGFLAQYKDDSILIGFALRAGWTKSYNLGIGGVASISGELGVAVGGVVVFEVAWGNATVRLNGPPMLEPGLLLESVRESLSSSHLALQKDELESLEESIALFEEGLRNLADIELRGAAEFFADIWGSVSGKVVGITLASISIHGRARFKFCFSTNGGITHVGAMLGFDLRVRILCFVFEFHASLTLTLKQGQCPNENLRAMLRVADSAPMLEDQSS